MRAIRLAGYGMTADWPLPDGWDTWAPERRQRLLDGLTAGALTACIVETGDPR